MSTADARSVERLDIYRNDERVGSLRRNAEGGSVFEYDAAFFAAHRHLPGGIATHLPYAKPSIESRGVNLPTYFAGLLPEGLRHAHIHSVVAPTLSPRSYVARLYAWQWLEAQERGTSTLDITPPRQVA